MKDVAKDTDAILIDLKNKNYQDRVALRGLFSAFSSMVETVEKAFLEEFINFRDRINQYAMTNKLQYTFPFDPVKVFGIRTTVRRNDQTNKFYTETRAIRHLLDHDHFKVDTTFNIHLKDPNDSTWNFKYDKTFTCKEFCDYVAEVALFYRTTMNLLFTIQLLGILRQCFVIQP